MILEGSHYQSSFKSFAIYIFQEQDHWLASQLFHISYFLSLHEVIDRRMEETLTAGPQDLLAKGEEEISGEVIPSEGEGNSPACQSFEEALFGWSWALKDWWVTPLIEEWRHHLTVSVIYFSNFYLQSIFLSILILITNVSILLFQGLREAAKMKHYTAHLECEGLQELDLAIVGTPATWIVDLISAGVHEAGRSAPPSPSALSPTVEGW